MTAAAHRSPAWHDTARAMRATGMTVSEVARRMGRPRDSVRYALDENGEQARVRERARRNGASIGVARSRRGESLIAHAERPEPHVSRQPRRILPADPEIMALCRQFAEHKIDYSELSRRLRVSG